MNIKTLLIPNDWMQPKHPLSPPVRVGYGNGYIGVPPEHPWFGKHYDYIDVDIHGGLTYGKDIAPQAKEKDGLWWIGFDTCHYQDNKYNCDKAYVEAQIESLKRQAIEACS